MKGLRYITCLFEFMGHVCMALGGDHGFRKGIGSHNDYRGETSPLRYYAGRNLAEPSGITALCIFARCMAAMTRTFKITSLSIPFEVTIA